MNIIVRPYGSCSCYCRPDTTWERENRDIYTPDCIDEWQGTPVVFVRISKAGKCIAPKFASRYYDALGFGVLLYIGDEETAFASCADHTSLLPSLLYNPVVLEGEDNVFEVTADGEQTFRYSTASDKDGNLKEVIEQSICLASRLISIRTGDFIAVELAPQSRICIRSEKDTALKATFCENTLIDCKIRF